VRGRILRGGRHRAQARPWCAPAEGTRGGARVPHFCGIVVISEASIRLSEHVAFSPGWQTLIGTKGGPNILTYYRLLVRSGPHPRLLTRQRAWRLLDGVSRSTVGLILQTRFPGWTLPPTYSLSPFLCTPFVDRPGRTRTRNPAQSRCILRQITDGAGRIEGSIAVSRVERR